MGSDVDIYAPLVAFGGGFVVQSEDTKALGEGNVLERAMISKEILWHRYRRRYIPILLMCVTVACLTDIRTIGALAMTNST